MEDKLNLQNLQNKMKEADRLLREGYTKNEIIDMLKLGIPKTKDGDFRYGPVNK